MRLPIYQVDSFADAAFGGNPAAVVPLQSWLADSVMQSIAAENNLSETAFFVREGGRITIRWFTPTCEVDLCGHATLASAYVYFHHIEPGKENVVFSSRSGELTVTRAGELLSMRLPSRPPAACEAPRALLEGLGKKPKEVLASRDYFAVYETEADILSLAPDMRLLAGLDRQGVIVTAPGARYDFVSRFFVPGGGIDEDPVTGSAHCTLIPYWAARLGKTKLRARQVSARGGDLGCEDRGDHVLVAGKVAPYLEGTIVVP
jgi:PhzF family phenazine biosynthesis protein